jgi:hypothetical protein
MSATLTAARTRRPAPAADLGPVDLSRPGFRSARCPCCNGIADPAFCLDDLVLKLRGETVFLPKSVRRVLDRLLAGQALTAGQVRPMAAAPSVLADLTDRRDDGKFVVARWIRDMERHEAPVLVKMRPTGPHG